MSDHDESLMYTQADLDAARRAAATAARKECSADVEAGEAALDVAAAEVARLRRIVDVASQAIAARDRFGWSPEADEAVGRLREIVGQR